MTEDSIVEGTYLHNPTDVCISYRFRASYDDRQHLVVVLSGFRENVHSVDFTSAATGVRCNILWLYDDIDGMPTYYYWGKGQKDLSQSFHGTIQHFMNELGLSIDQVTLFGLSKGANASLLYAARYGYKNVIASAPRAFNGSSMRRHHRDVFDHIVGQKLDPAQVEAELDNELEYWNAIDNELDKSIFVTTAPADIDRYYSESTAITRMMSKYTNFCIIQTKSPIVQGHIDVSRYNLPLYLSLMTQFSEGFTPSLAGRTVSDEKFESLGGVLSKSIRNGSYNHDRTVGNNESLRRRWHKGALRSTVQKVALNSNSILRISGYSIVNGRSSDRHGLSSMRLLFQNSMYTTQSEWAPLGSSRDASLSRVLFDSEFTDYTYGGFATTKDRGIQLAGLPYGHYKMGIELTRDARTFTERRLPAPVHDIWMPAGDRIIGSHADGTSWTVTSTPSIARRIRDCYFELVRLQMQSTLLFVEGYFIPAGTTTDHWDSIRYYLVLESVDDTNGEVVVKTFQLENGFKRDAAERSGEFWRNQSRAYFATKNFEGLDLSSVPVGSYNIYITGRRHDDVFTMPIAEKLHVEYDVPVEVPKIAVLGSCVSRDNFNSRISPKWRDYWSLSSTLYQASLISLMAPPVDVDSYDFSDMDWHSAETTRRDFSKTFLTEVLRDPPEVMLVDLFADARFGVIEVDGSFATHNEWTLTESAGYSAINRSEIYSRTSNPAQFEDLFILAVESFAQFVNSYLPDTKICLNRARHVNLHRGLGSSGKVFSPEVVGELNATWSNLDNIFERVVKPTVIDPMNDDLQGDSFHPWGPGPVHYEPQYYEVFHQRLLRSADRMPTFVIR